MKRIAIALACAALVGASIVDVPVARAAGARPQQAANPQKEVKLKKEEYDAFKAVEAAPTVDAKIVAAKAFAQKFPTSAAAESVEIIVADAIGATTQDPNLATYVTEFQTLYPTSERTGHLQIKLLDQHVVAGDWASANKVGEAFLTTTPDDVRVHFRLLEIGLEAVKQKDGSFLESATKHGVRAVELFTTDKRPAGMPDAEWVEYKKRFLPKTHQSLGLLAYATQSFDTSVQHLTEAAKLNPTDPFNHFFLGAVEDSRYNEIAQKFNSMPKKDSPEAKQLLEESAKKEDLIIGHFVKVVALGEDNPQYAQLVAQARPSLEEHYKHRHNNTLDGLDAMIKAAKATP
jgi:hypothetical protein